MIRYLVANGLHRSGLMGLWRRATRDQISVLTVHSVLDQPHIARWQPLRTFLPVEKLRENLAFLQQRCTFISLEQARAILAGESEPVPNATVLTFDDGYMNNFTVALPVLQSLGVPGAFFIVSDRVKNRSPFWFDRVDYALQKNVTESYTLDVLGEPVEVKEPSRDALRTAMLRCFAIMMSKGYGDQELEAVAGQVIAPVEALAGKSLITDYADTCPAAVVTEDVLRAAAADPLVTIGSHTHTHVRLPTLSAERAAMELDQSRQAIQALTGKQPDTFCFPNGDHDATSRALVAQSGYHIGLTCVEGLNDPRSCDPLLLNRINWPINATPVELLALACGAYRDSYGWKKGQRDVIDEAGAAVKVKPQPSIASK